MRTGAFSSDPQCEPTAPGSFVIAGYLAPAAMALDGRSEHRSWPEMANEHENGGGLLTRAVLDAALTGRRGLGPLVESLLETQQSKRRGLLSYVSALDGFVAVPPVGEVSGAHQPDINYVIWHGASGTRYSTQCDPIGTPYKPREGVYIFCKIAPNGSWYPVYVGETDSFQRRLSDELDRHHRWASIMREGATHICTLHLTGGLALREGVETDLRHRLNPPCNLQ